MFELESKQQLLTILNDLHPAEAIKILPDVKAQFLKLVENTKKTEAETLRRQAVCDENDKLARFLAGKCAELSAQLATKKSELRQELYSLQGDFAVTDHAASIRQMTDSLGYFTEEHDHLISVRRGADHVHFLDSVEVWALAKALEANCAASLSHVDSVSKMAGVFESEGPCGIIGTRTELLRTAAAQVDREHENTRHTAREARLAYERSQAARISKGIITSGTVNRAVPR